MRNNTHIKVEKAIYTHNGGNHYIRFSHKGKIHRAGPFANVDEARESRNVMFKVMGKDARWERFIDKES